MTSFTKRLAAIVASAAMLGALAACSQDSAGGGDSEAGDLTDTSISGEIRYAFWDLNQKPAMEQTIAAFNKKYPDVKVKIETTPGPEFFEKLQTQASSDTLPDVFWMNAPNFQLYASNKMLEPATPLIDQKLADPANYPPELNELYTLDGVQYGLPKDYDTIAVFYNKALFDKAGVEYPSKDWTWEEMREKAKAVSTKLDGVYGVAGNVAGGHETYYNTMLQAGGTIISEDKKKSGFDDPKSIEGLQYIRDLIADKSMPTPAELSDTPANQMFLNGRAAMFWAGSWSNAELLGSDLKKDIEVAPLPAGPDGSATVIHGLTNAVSAKSENKPAAQAFQAFLSSEEAAQIQAEAGAAVPAFNGTQTAWVESAPWNLQVFLDEAEKSAVPYPVSLNTAEWNQLEVELLPQAFSGERPVEEVAAELATKMNKILADEK